MSKLVSANGKPLGPAVPSVVMVHPDGQHVAVPFPQFCLEMQAYLGQLSFGILHQGEHNGEGTEDRGGGVIEADGNTQY